MITMAEILMGREEEFPLSNELKANAKLLLVAVNKLRALYGRPMYVSSGYRPGHFNTSAGGAVNSPHITCQAVDFADRDGKLEAWLTEDILKECGLYKEDPIHTPTWVHVQTRPTKNRIFKP